MGDVLPPKRTVVERLRVRLERYRWHHNSCLPRYEQSASALYERQRQDTIRLKQRFLESKAKKAKTNKSDLHRAPVAVRESTPDTQKHAAHSKPAKTVAEGSPATTNNDLPTDDGERSTKNVLPENVSNEPTVKQPTTPSFSLPIVQQFPKCNTSKAIQSGSSTSECSLQQTIPVSQSQNLVPSQPVGVVQQTQQQTAQVEASSNIKCKQEEEKPPDLCQFKAPTPNSIVGDRLSDTFPSLGFAEDSGDNVIHPDVLKDLIDDVFTTPGDIFDFENSMEDSGNDNIDELVESSTSSSLFSGHSITQAHPSGTPLFDNSVATTTAPTTSSSVTSTSVYGTQQRHPTYSGVNNLNHPNGLGLDFKLTEPSPAALTLKQMAEQHQNMQQKQQQLSGNINSFNLRTQFNMDAFTDPMSNFGTRFLSRPVQRTQSSSMFQAMTYDSNYPGVIPISDNSLFKQESCNIGTSGPLMNSENQKHHLLQMSRTAVEKKHLPCGGDRSGFYQDNIVQANPNQHVTTTQYIGNATSDIQMHRDQPQQMPPRPLQNVSRDIKQTDMLQQPYSNMYPYNVQSGNEHMFHVPVNQNPSFNTTYAMHPNGRRPPPEYKVPQMNIRPINMPLEQAHLQQSPTYHQHMAPHPTSTNLTINQWRSVRQPNHSVVDLFQQQDGYGNLDCTGAIPSSVHHSPMYHPYRTVGSGGQLPPNHMPIVSSSHSALHQVGLHQQQHTVNSGLGNINLNLGSTSATQQQLYTGHQELNARDDNNPMSLDFLDHIGNSEPDLLNFDNVIQNTDTTHFQLLDDMEMLSK